MKTFSAFLTEARKNPDQNPKVSLYDVAEKYQKDPMIFMSFVSDVNLVRASKKIKDVNSEKLNNLDPIKSTWKDEEAVHIAWEKQADKLKNQDESSAGFGFKIGINPKSGYNTPIGIYCYSVKETMQRYMKSTRKIVVPFAGQQPGVYFIRPKDKSKILDLGDMTQNDYKRDEKKIREMLIHDPKLKKNFDVQYRLHLIIEHIKTTAKVQSPGGWLWNLTRWAAHATKGAIENNRLKNQKGVTVRWNKILRDLGYQGAIDSKGKGIIHEAEPWQAVFFSGAFVEVVDFSLNKDYIIKAK